MSGSSLSTTAANVQGFKMLEYYKVNRDLWNRDRKPRFRRYTSATKMLKYCLGYRNFLCS